MHPLYVHVLGWIILKIHGAMMGVMTSGHLECDAMTLGHPCEGPKGKPSFRVPSLPSLLLPIQPSASRPRGWAGYSKRQTREEGNRARSSEKGAEPFEEVRVGGRRNTVSLLQAEPSHLPAV